MQWKPTPQHWGLILTKWRGPPPCNTASERSSSRAIWGKASPTQPLLAGTPTPTGWPHPDHQNLSKVKLTLNRLTSSTARTEPGYDGTPTDYCKDQVVFDAEAVPFLFVSEQIARTASLVLLSAYLQWPSMVRNLSFSTCVISVPLYWNLLLYILTPDYLCLPICSH